MSDIFNQIELREKFFLRNLVVYPVTLSNGGNGNGLITLDEAFKDDKMVMNDVIGVNDLKVENISENPLIILDGETLRGARQDRMVNTTAILEPQREVLLPVSCIEQSRWHGNTSFETSLSLAFPSLRSILRLSVYKNLKASNKRKSDQQRIWDKIKTTLNITQVKSHTQSIHDVYNSLKDEIEAYVEGSSTVGPVNGYLVYLDNRFVSLDIFSSSEILKKYQRKLFESYAMQGILDRYGLRDLKKIDLPPDSIKELSALQYDEFSGVSLEKELRHAGEFLVSITLKKDNNKFVYASVVPGIED